MRRRDFLLGAASALAVSKASKSDAAFAIFQTAAGPAQAMGWSTLPIGGGGFARSLKVNPTDGTILVQTDGAGGWLWSAAAAKWIQALQVMPAAYFNEQNSWLPGGGTYALDSAPSNPNIMYVAQFSQILVSTNKAASWSATAFSEGTNIFASNTNYDTVSPKLAIDPANPNIVYISTYTNGVWFTINGGTSWTQISTSQIPAGTTEPSQGGHPGYTILFDPTSAVTGGATQGIYISSYGNGLYHSTNGGTTFSSVAGAPTTITMAKITSAGLYYCLWNTVFGSISQLPMDFSVYNGSTWTILQTYANFGNNYIVAFCINPNNLSQIMIFENSGYCLASLNAGSTWGSFGTTATFTGPIGWQDFPDPGQTFTLTVSNSEFDPRTPGQVLISHGSGLTTITFPSSGNFAGGVMPFTTNSQGQESLVGNKIVILPNSNGFVVRCDDFAIFKLDGVNYPATNPSGFIDNGFGFYVSDIDYARDLSGTIITQLGNDSIISTDWGATWSAMPNIPASAQGSIAASTSSNWIYGEYGTGLWGTNNAGATWTPITVSGAVWAGYSSFTMIADGATPNLYYLLLAQSGLTAQGVWQITYSGGTWTATQVLTGDLGSVNRFQYPGIMKAVPGRVGHLFWGLGAIAIGQSAIGGSYYLLFSSNGGVSWTRVPEVLQPFGFGFGPPAAGHSYNSIYYVGYDAATQKVFAMYRCINFDPSNVSAATWAVVGTTGTANAGSLVVGNAYVIASIGTTDFTSIGAPSNTVGVPFVATGVGSGTGTLLTGGMNNNAAPAGNLVYIAWFDADITNYGRVAWSTGGEGYCQGYFP